MNSSSGLVSSSELVSSFGLVLSGTRVPEYKNLTLGFMRRSRRMATQLLPTIRNHWPDDKCAKAFWSQQEVRPYRRLLNDTIAWCNPLADEQWLDLGCGSGPITRALWEKTGGELKEILGLDCAPINEIAYKRLCRALKPMPSEEIRFLCHDFSVGLDILPDESFDHAVSGLAITYAVSFSEEENRWTSEAYDRLLAEVCRVIRPGGRFVFSVNVPDPKWWKIGLLSLGDMFRAGHPLRFLKRALRMVKYGSWLKQEARIGRFHYFPEWVVKAKLAEAGFEQIEHRLSYSNQAFIFRAIKPR